MAVDATATLFIVLEQHAALCCSLALASALALALALRMARRAHRRLQLQQRATGRLYVPVRSGARPVSNEYGLECECV